MGGCASRPKESDMKNEEGPLPNKLVSETVVAKENNREESSEKHNQSETETTEASVEAKETSQTESTKEPTTVVEPEADVAVEESSSTGEFAATPEKVKNEAVAPVNTETSVDAVVVAAPEKVEVAVEAVKTVEAEPVNEESKKEEKEVVATV